MTFMQNSLEESEYNHNVDYDNSMEIINMLEANDFDQVTNRLDRLDPWIECSYDDEIMELGQVPF